MRTRRLGYLTSLTAAFSLAAGIATANCQLQQLGSLPVDMHGLNPIVTTRINGVEARFILDSGSFYSMISDDAAAKYQLRVNSVSSGSYDIYGVRGYQRARMTTVNAFEFAGVTAAKIRFLVIDTSFGDEIAGYFGQNLLRFSDVEYDLANGIVRFFKPIGCEQRSLAYWAVSTPYTAVDLQLIDATEDHLRSTAMVNGHSVSVYFDTGFSRSYLSLQAAAAMGITPDSPGVTFLGAVMGPGTKTWLVPVDSFQLGGEKVQHTHLLMADLEPHRFWHMGTLMPDMFLGDDFFLSHRIYVAYGQRKLYFTYNGGPLFNLSLPQTAAAAPKAPANAAAVSQANAATGEQPDSDTPTDADGFKRRGLAYASMGEFDRALSDLTRACELAPRDADDRYSRGVIYLNDQQFKPALQDFSAAITLQPADIDARLDRATLLELHPDTDPTAAPEIESDLDAVARLAAPDANVHLQLGHLYGRHGDYPAAIDQINQWLSHHSSLPSDRVTGLNARCWWRAAGNRDLQAALDDCNHALSLYFTDAEVRDSRGLVYLRLGNLDDAIQDYDLALRADPNIASSLYGRGLAELRLGETAQSQADLAAARKLDSGIVKQFSDMGLYPDGVSR